MKEKQEFIEERLSLFQSRNPPDISGLSHDVVEVLLCVRDHGFDSSLNVGTIKNLCQIRNNNISTRFRTALGIGIREYIEMTRLEAAAHLLEEDLEVYLVAMAVGYEHQETFCRAFQRYFGCTTSEYRARSLPRSCADNAALAG